MSYFIGLGIPYLIDDIEGYFDKTIILHDITGTPFGNDVSGNKPNRKAYALIYNMDSASLLNQKRRKPYKAHLVTESIERLLCKVPTVSLIYHWFHGLILTERFPILRKVRISFDDFRKKYPSVDYLKKYPSIDEDVRYVIFKEM